jgi:cell division protein FtsN
MAHMALTFTKAVHKKIVILFLVFSSSEIVHIDRHIPVKTDNDQTQGKLQYRKPERYWKVIF